MSSNEKTAVRESFEGVVERDHDGFNGSPHVMIVGTHWRSDSDGVGSGKFHPRFLINEDKIGRKIKITIEYV